MEKSKILIIGVTGNLGYHLAEASLKFRHPTFALVRHSAFSNPIKAQKLHSLSQGGATILTVSFIFFLSFFLFQFLILVIETGDFYGQGSLEDETAIAEAVRLVDVVICAVSAQQCLHQKLLIRVIKQLGSVKVILNNNIS